MRMQAEVENVRYLLRDEGGEDTETVRFPVKPEVEDEYPSFSGELSSLSATLFAMD